MNALALTFKSHQGSLAQYTRLPASHVVPRPPTLSPTEAAGLTLVGLTAYQALFTIAKLEEGQHLFVNGGSTAVGIAAIQLAKAVGCTVTASASDKREPLLRSLGVDNASVLNSPWIYRLTSIKVRRLHQGSRLFSAGTQPSQSQIPRHFRRRRQHRCSFIHAQREVSCTEWYIRQCGHDPPKRVELHTDASLCL